MWDCNTCSNLRCTSWRWAQFRSRLAALTSTKLIYAYVFKQNSVESGQHNVDPAQMMERNASARKLILNFRETRAWTKVQGKWFIVNHSAFAAAGNQRRAVKRTRPVSE